MRLATKKCLHLYHFSPLRFPINDQSIKRIPGPKHGLETSHLTWFSFHTNCGPPRNNTLCSWVFVASTSAKRPKKGHKSMRTLNLDCVSVTLTKQIFTSRICMSEISIDRGNTLGCSKLQSIPCEFVDQSVRLHESGACDSVVFYWGRLQLGVSVATPGRASAVLWKPCFHGTVGSFIQ